MVMQIKSKFSRLWPHRDRIDDGVFFLNLSHANGLDIVNVVIPFMKLFLVYNYMKLLLS